jgi:hypothetical protein
MGFVDDSVRIEEFVWVCKVAGRPLSDAEFNLAKCLDWVLTCPDRGCAYYRRNGKTFNARDSPCIECQTEPEEDQ